MNAFHGHPAAAARIILVAAVCACGPSRDEAASLRSVNPDSASITSALDLFRKATSGAPDSLSDGAHSESDLVSRFVAAVEAVDTATLRHLAITRGEFAYLYYPASPMSRPPYQLEPDLMWMQINSQRNRGLDRLLSQYGGHPLHYISHDCTPPQQYGGLTLIRTCRVVHKKHAEILAEPLFGSIIAVRGRYKFVGYANKL